MRVILLALVLCLAPLVTYAQPHHFVVMSTSLRAESLNAKLLDGNVVTYLTANKAKVTRLQMKDFLAPNIESLIPSPDYQAEPEAFEKDVQTPANIKQLIKIIHEADAVIIASPEYNGSFPGHFKTTFDWLSMSKVKPWHKKPIFLLSTSPGTLGGIKGLLHFRHIFTSNGAYVYPSQFALPNGNKHLDEKNQIDNEKLKGYLEQSLQGFMEFTRRISQE